ncbi:MAG TPA: TadE/TadG family type IV pilus assembly protein, partial [Anaerolineales bacterium]|nr:TadE/TadG family type IV pilus assembly protein [Anaerolineales bacterium]
MTILRLLPPRRTQQRAKAQAIVEFAIVLPILLLVLVGIMEVSRLMFAWIVIENSTRFGVRYATAGSLNPAYCAGYPGGKCETDAQKDAARIPSIKDETQRIVIGFFLRNTRTESVTKADERYFNITVCSAEDGRVFTPPVNNKPVYASCLLGGSPSEHPGSPGQRVVVAADYNFTFIVLSAFGIQPEMIHLASYREGIVENFRAVRAINTPLSMAIPTVPTNTPLPTETFTPSMTPTETSTPTMTYTPTPTPTPDCREYTAGSFSQRTYSSNGSKPRVRIAIRNQSGTNTAIQSLIFIWDAYDTSNPGQTLYRIRFDGDTLENVYDSDSPSQWDSG